MDLRVCVCVRAAVCTWSLLRRESCIDVNSFSHSHARPEHMALRQHTLCLHVPSSSPLSPVSSITSPLFPRIHQFPPQFPPVASQTIANAISPRRLRYAVTFTFCVCLWFWFYCSCVVSHHFYFAFLFWIRVRRRCVKTQPQVVSERGENNFGSSFFFSCWETHTEKAPLLRARRLRQSPVWVCVSVIYLHIAEAEGHLAPKVFEPTQLAFLLSFFFQTVISSVPIRSIKPDAPGSVTHILREKSQLNPPVFLAEASWKCSLRAFIGVRRGVWWCVLNLAHSLSCLSDSMNSTSPDTSVMARQNVCGDNKLEPA